MSEDSREPITLERARLLDERDGLIHDLEVHQAELEAQNQQLREAQHVIEESRARYSDLYDFAPVAYCTLDPSGCITEINLTGATMLGTPRSRAIGKPFAVFVSPGDRAAFRTHLQARLASSEGQAVVELTLAAPDRQPIAIQLVSTVAVDRSGTICGCRSAFTDVSEQKRAEEMLRLAVRMREEFLAIVSHDLGNPLNSILLGSEMLLASSLLDAKSLDHVRIIHNASGRMSRMLGDLLDLSSMDAGHLSMERRPEPIADLLAATVESMNDTAAKKTIRLETVLGSSPLFAFCDRERILQVLTNLVANAIKFTPAGGHIRIEATRKLEEIVIAVRDSGAGMTKSQLDHVFDPYWQVAKTAKLGTGLGLSIARGIVEFHGGQIWVESEVDRGSSFYFALPYGPLPARSRVKSGPLSGSLPIVKQPTESVRAGGAILIVDDEPDVHVLLTDLLRGEGYDVVNAVDGVEALAYLRAATTLPFLILLDLVMPNMDGWQFMEECRQDDHLAGISVVLISSQVTARETARSLGLASYIGKPIARPVLLETVSRVRERSRALA